jgi:hypothetical protein
VWWYQSHGQVHCRARSRSWVRPACSRSRSSITLCFHPNRIHCCRLTGICAALLAKGTSEVVLTDVAVHVPSLASSIKLNFSSPSDSPAQCSARALDWLAPLPVDLRKPVDVILAADVVWLTDLIEPLVNTLGGLASETTVILLAYQSRSKRADHLLFAALQLSFTWYVGEEEVSYSHAIVGISRTQCVVLVANRSVLMASILYFETPRRCLCTN